MFAVSSSLMLAHLGAYLLVPVLMGIVATWLIAGTRLRGRLFYLMSRFIGTGVVGYGLFLLQFVRYGIDWVAYLILFALLIVFLVVKVAVTKIKFSDLCKTLRVSFHISYWKTASKQKKVLTVLL